MKRSYLTYGTVPYRETLLLGEYQRIMSPSIHQPINGLVNCNIDPQHCDPNQINSCSHCTQTDYKCGFLSEVVVIPQPRQFGRQFGNEQQRFQKYILPEPLFDGDIVKIVIEGAKTDDFSIKFQDKFTLYCSEGKLTIGIEESGRVMEFGQMETTLAVFYQLLKETRGILFRVDRQVEVNGIFDEINTSPHLRTVISAPSYQCGKHHENDSARVNQSSFVQKREIINNGTMREFVYRCQNHNIFTQQTLNSPCDIFVGCNVTDHTKLSSTLYDPDLPWKKIRSIIDISKPLAYYRCRKDCCEKLNLYASTTEPICLDRTMIRELQGPGPTVDPELYVKYSFVYKKKLIDMGFDPKLLGFFDEKMAQNSISSIPLLKPCVHYYDVIEKKLHSNKNNWWSKKDKTCVCMANEGWIGASETYEGYGNHTGMVSAQPIMFRQFKSNSCVLVGGGVRASLAIYYASSTPEIIHVIDRPTLSLLNLMTSFGPDTYKAQSLAIREQWNESHMQILQTIKTHGYDAAISWPLYENMRPIRGPIITHEILSYMAHLMSGKGLGADKFRSFISNLVTIRPDLRYHSTKAYRFVLASSEQSTFSKGTVILNPYMALWRNDDIPENNKHDSYFCVLIRYDRNDHKSLRVYDVVSTDFQEYLYGVPSLIIPNDRQSLYGGIYS